ncbi:ImuA family protein [Loktanella sp. 3ANDIMAR09]|uniref:ImuA family protein n=1 Tax=Loktanella sp. 3ANDIMAR09 TaxID=1225657 RepID=UPI0007007830|nr:hypothetical protein [Loktanella sp. 3ANDIMAR09]
MPPVQDPSDSLFPGADQAMDHVHALEPTLSECFATSTLDAAVIGFVCAQLAALAGDPRPVLWVQDRISRREAGRPYLAGLPRGLKLLHVMANRPVDVLWAMEEALYSSGVCAVLGEVWGDPPALDFTATKRLALRAEARAVPALLVRRAATPNLSAARQRWRIAALPALPEPYDNRAPGAPLWQAELFRARGRAPGSWVARQDHRGLVLSHATAPDTAMPAAARA